MPVISLSYFEESEVVTIFFAFLVLCNSIQNVSRGEVVPRRAKKSKKVLVQRLFTETHLTVLNVKKLHKKIV